MSALEKLQKNNDDKVLDICELFSLKLDMRVTNNFSV